MSKINEMIETEISLQDLAALLSIDTKVVEFHDIGDMGLQIETPTGFKDVASYVVKESTEGWQLGDLLATSVHEVLQNNEWKMVSEIPEATATGKMISVVDLEVPDGNCYNANGWVNHNTTPGGLN